MIVVSDSAAYQVLLGFLSPADHASLRLVSRSWQALVDRSLGCLYPLAVTPFNFGFGSVPCLVYQSLFQSSSIKQHLLDAGPVHAGFYLISRQFTNLHTLAVDCQSKGCVDFEHLPLLLSLRRLRLGQFSFSEDALAGGLGRCSGLQVLHLESQQAMLQVRSLRHLSGLAALQELVVQPRGYINVPPESAAGLAALACLTRLTQLQLVTAIKPSRCPLPGDPSSSSSLVGPFDDTHGFPAGRSVFFNSSSAAGGCQLSVALAHLARLQVLRLVGVAGLPGSLSGLSCLRELSLERVGCLSRQALTGLQKLSQLTALTLLAAAEPLFDQQQQLGGMHAAASSSSSSSSDSPWLLLLQLPQLRELVVGVVPRNQTLNLTTTLAQNLEPPEPYGTGHTRHPSDAAAATSRQPSVDLWQQQAFSHTGLGLEAQRGRPGLVLRQQQQQQQGSGCDQGLWFQQGCGGQRYAQQEGAAVTAYVTPGLWSDLADMQGVQRVAVEARGWHSAAITAQYSSAAEAAASMMTWHCVAPPLPPSLQPTSAAAHASSALSAGALGVWFNHPSQCGYCPSLLPLLLLAPRPCMGRLGLLQQQAAAQQLLAVQQQQAVGVGDGGLAEAHHHQHQHMVLRGAGPESAARRLLLAQLRAAMHPSKLLLVLGASATHLRRLELTVDQSWPGSVLASLGQLRRLSQLQVLKLDCGRQAPPPEMWSGLSGLTSLQWLCLRWLDTLPAACLAPLTGLVALQLKAITLPPAAAELAEALAGMPKLSALAIEGGLLGVQGDWLRDAAGLLRHGRWTSSWVEHTLCRQPHLRVLGSITAALLMTVALNSPRWPEMVASTLLAAAAGAVFVLAVAASLLSLMLASTGAAAGHGGEVRSQQHQAGPAGGPEVYFEGQAGPEGPEDQAAAAAANRVEVAAVGRGSAVVRLVAEMPELRFLDVTWLNLEPWELQGLAQQQQLHYLGLCRQQAGVLLSQEASGGGVWGGRAGDADVLGGAGWLEGGPAMVLVEAPAGFDEVIERDVMTSAAAE
ncbi:hypothetical protein OEZ86_003590 [Tetradesmus obliquus]|nr:hypothetical protein OEZ86_003590 [Tetradesmus obliquus]